MSIFFRKIAVFGLVAWMVWLTPVLALANGVDALGNPTGAPVCTGAGCGQGAGQGEGQGGPTLEDLGGYVDENGNDVLPDDVEDTRQGARQGTDEYRAEQEQAEIEAENTNTGAGSDNDVAVDVNNDLDTVIDNDVVDNTNADLEGVTGQNISNRNTETGAVDTGNASIGVTQVKSDNTATVNGGAGVSSTGYAGDHLGDLQLGFGGTTANFSDSADVGSVKVINETTGADSDNDIVVTTRTEELTEVQNDGVIDNILNLSAITGQNDSNRNTSDGVVETGDANVAATLVNLLNTTVINGDIWITVADIFGNLEGDVNLDNLSGLAAAHRSELDIEVGNDNTGADSTNNIDIDVTEEETFNVDNDADIDTEFNVDAITGQNVADRNTGGSVIETGDANVAAGQVSVANTTVEGGSWGLVIVNALNGWLGYLVGESGQAQALSQDETIREIEARNSETGADSTNNLTVDIDDIDTTNVDNNATINNEINASAITGQNTASENTGQGNIGTGDANVTATAVNIANTTVKDGSLFIAVVNVFGSFLGDVMYDGGSLASASHAGSEVDIETNNNQTGADSTNTVDVDIDRTHTTNIDNDVAIDTVLNANIDTGNNRANSNTRGAGIVTGEGFLALNSRVAANLVAIAGAGGIEVNMQSENGETGVDSTNTINADVNDARIINVDNSANVSTVVGVGGPATVNTGDNEASRNTLGAAIVTGNANASGVIENLVNEVVVALGDAGQVVDVEFVNMLTGMLSTNSNSLTTNYDAILNLVNNADLETLIDLLLNTGGNTANENTGGEDLFSGAAYYGAAAHGANIASGAACVRNMRVANNANGVQAQGINGGAQANNAVVNVVGNIVAQTGNNVANGNVAGVASPGQANCDPVVAVVPDSDPGDGGSIDLEVENNDGGSGSGGGSGGGDAEADGGGAVLASVSGSKPGRINGGNILKRFPVAGGELVAKLRHRNKKAMWPLAMAGGVVALTATYALDKNARNARVRGYA